MVYRQAYIEITNVCNLKCNFCPRVNKRGEHMAAEVFSQIAEQVRPLVQQAYLHVLGEPLLHPDFDEIIHICSRLDLPVEIVTNGTCLDETKRSSLLNPIVRQINFSLQALIENFTPDKAEQILSTIWEFSELARAERPDLYINYRLWNLASIADGRSAWANSPLINALKRLSGFETAVLEKPLRRKGIKLRERSYLHIDSRFVWPELEAATEPQDRGYCHALKSQFAILLDGTVVPCCLDYMGVMRLGNCREEPLAAILKNERATAIRNGFENGKRVEDLCKKCCYSDRFKSVHGTNRTELQVANKTKG